MSITENVNRIKQELGSNVTLIAVTKMHEAEEINEAIRAGVTDIGENKVQELLSKYEFVDPVRWHLIGHLQTNKVKQIIDKVCLIHSVDSYHLAEEINKRAKEHGIVMDILLQVNAVGEESKSGMAPDEVKDVLMNILENCENVRVRGLMNIAPLSEDPNDAKTSFGIAKKLFDELSTIKHDNLLFDTLSMGMSFDYQIAINEGSNMVRIGTAIFGARDYSKK